MPTNRVSVPAAAVPTRDEKIAAVNRFLSFDVWRREITDTAPTVSALATTMNMK